MTLHDSWYSFQRTQTRPERTFGLAAGLRGYGPGLDAYAGPGRPRRRQPKLVCSRKRRINQHCGSVYCIIATPARLLEYYDLVLEKEEVISWIIEIH